LRSKHGSLLSFIELSSFYVVAQQLILVNKVEILCSFLWLLSAAQ
jgi:hypothetical protein